MMQYPCTACGGRGPHMGPGHQYTTDPEFNLTLSFNILATDLQEDSSQTCATCATLTVEIPQNDIRPLLNRMLALVDRIKDEDDVGWLNDVIEVFTAIILVFDIALDRGRG